jgi:hypothetical protein
MMHTPTRAPGRCGASRHPGRVGAGGRLDRDSQALGGGDQFAKFLEPVVKDAALVTPEGSVNQERLFSLLSVVMALIGWFVADLFYRRKPGMADRVVARIGGLYACW